MRDTPNERYQQARYDDSAAFCHKSLRASNMRDKSGAGTGQARIVSPPVESPPLELNFNPLL
jgi:hypothetical protein